SVQSFCAAKSLRLLLFSIIRWIVEYGSVKRSGFAVLPSWESTSSRNRWMSLFARSSGSTPTGATGGGLFVAVFFGVGRTGSSPPREKNTMAPTTAATPRRAAAITPPDEDFAAGRIVDDPEL